MPGEPSKFQWEWKVKASLETIWRALVGKKMVAKNEGFPLGEGTILLVADIQQRILDEVLPKWEIKGTKSNWVHANVLFSEITFASGPIYRMKQEVHLSSLQEGSLISHQIEVEGSGLFSAVLIPYWIGYRLSHFLQRFYSSLTASSLEHKELAASLTQKQQLHLREAAQGLLKEHFRQLWIKQLVTFALEGAERQVYEMSPFYLAHLWGVPSRRLLDLFLASCRYNLLRLKWLIHCSSCGQASPPLANLGLVKSQQVCPHCKEEFTVDPQINLQIAFCPHPAIRPVAAVQNHADVLFFKEVEKGQSFTTQLELPQGHYRASLVGAKMAGAINFNIQEGKKTSLSLEIEDSKVITFFDPILKPGFIRVSNRMNTAQTLKIENLEAESLATRGRPVFNSAYFRKFFPEQVIAPFEYFKLNHVILLAIEVVGFAEVTWKKGDRAAFYLFRSLSLFIEESVASLGGALVRASQGNFLLSFESGIDALKGALLLHEKISSFNISREESEAVGLKMSLHNGSSIVASISRDFDYCGSAAHLVEVLLASCVKDQLLLTPSFLKLSKISHYLEGLQHPKDAADLTIAGLSEPLKVLILTFKPAENLVKEAPLEE